MADIFCIVDGDEFTFSVIFDATKRVDHLKKAIKAENPELDGIAAHKLKLYKIDVDGLDQANRKKLIEEAKQKNPELLHTLQKISTVFHVLDPPTDKIYIFVIPPEGESILDSSACSVVAHRRRAAASAQPTRASK